MAQVRIEMVFLNVMEDLGVSRGNREEKRGAILPQIFQYTCGKRTVLYQGHCGAIVKWELEPHVEPVGKEKLRGTVRDVIGGKTDMVTVNFHRIDEIFVKMHHALWLTGSTGGVKPVRMIHGAGLTHLQAG